MKELLLEPEGELTDTPPNALLAMGEIGFVLFFNRYNNPEQEEHKFGTLSEAISCFNDFAMIIERAELIKTSGDNRLCLMKYNKDGVSYFQ